MDRSHGPGPGLEIGVVVDHELHRGPVALGELRPDNPDPPGLKAAIIDSFTSTPLTLERISGNSEGAITGWAFTNDVMPAVRSLPGVAKSVLTPIPDVYQAGQWTYSPSGLPISILTGKLVADRILKDLA